MTIRLGTFNLCRFVAPPTACYDKKGKYAPQAWKKKMQWIDSQIDRMRCDVIGFQEVFSTAELAQLVEARGFGYFEIMEQPAAGEDAHVLNASVVAMASKHPMTRLPAISAPRNFNQIFSPTLGHREFSFSRMPLPVEVQFPLLGPVIILNLHLKSNRPLTITQGNPLEHTRQSAQNDVREVETHDFEHPFEHQALQLLRQRSAGRVGSLMQRGLEAVAVYEWISRYLAENKPVIVMGDLNDLEDSIVVAALCGRCEADEDEYLPPRMETAADKLRLYDAYRLLPDPTPRPRTFVHRKEGKVLDYIFVSNVFHPRAGGCGWVGGCETLDDHLARHPDPNKSDHAQVVVELTTSTSSIT